LSYPFICAQVSVSRLWDLFG